MPRWAPEGAPGAGFVPGSTMLLCPVSLPIIKVVGKSTGKVHVFTPATMDSVNNDISHHIFADDDLVLLFDEPIEHYTLARKVERSGRKRSTKRQSTLRSDKYTTEPRIKLGRAGYGCD